MNPSQAEVDESQEHIELLKEAYRAYNDGDVESVVAVMAEDIEWTEPEGLSFSGTHHGPEAVVQDVFAPINEQFGDVDLEVDRFVADGDTVVALGTARGVGRETDAEYDLPFAHVYDIENGQVTRFVHHTNTYLWREASSA